MNDTEYTPIEGLIMHITRRAVLVKVEGADDVWITLSVIHEEDVQALSVHEYMEINIAAWFCAKEGL